MSRKIVGITVGTSLSPEKFKEKITSELTEAINNALKQAKESGEFDGKDGIGIESVDVPGDGTFEIHTSDGNITVITLPEGKDGISITDVNTFMQDDGTTTVEIYDENQKQLARFDIPPGKDYVLTDDDKDEIAEMVEGLVVTVTGNTASHSSREIAEYVKSGKNVVLKIGNDWYSFISYNEDIDCVYFIQVEAMEADYFVWAQVMGNRVVIYTMSNSGGNAENGEDGFSPIATVTQTASGAVISITDKNGTTTATITNGNNGSPGVDGSDGITPHIGSNGNWFVGNTDTGKPSRGADGQPGQNGSPGKDGTSVTVSSVTESTESGGNNIVKFSDGKTLTVKNGKTGKDGEDGADGRGITAVDLVDDDLEFHYSDGEIAVIPLPSLSVGTGFLYCNESGLNDADEYVSLGDLGKPAGYTPKVGDFVLCADGKLFRIVNISEEFGAELEAEGFQLNLEKVDLTSYAKEQWVQQNYQPKGNYLTQHQDISHKLDASKLPEAVNTALSQAKASGEFDGDHGESAHEIALRNGFVGDEKAWLASLHAANPLVLNKSQFGSESEAIAYMDAQGDNSAVYVWNNKLYSYASMEVDAICGVNIYNYRNSASSGIKASEYATLLIFPVSSFTVPITIDFTGYKLSQSPHIYGGTTNNVFSTTLIGDGSTVAYIGATGPITLTDLKGCTYIAFAIDIADTTKDQDIAITVNDTPIVLKGISSPSEIDSGMSSGATTINGFADSGVEYTAIIGQGDSNEYLDSRNTYVMPVPRGYCETHVPGKTITANWLGLYDFPTMTAMFTALATAHPDYVTETVLGKDASGTYDIKQYVLDAPSTLSSGYTSAMKHEKPVFILTSGLHGDEQDAVHMVYHFMKDLCENHMESDQLEYLRNNVKFVVVPICNPWGYVNKAHYNVNSVDLNKNFESGYRNNGTANTGTAGHSEAETKLLKGVFDTYSNAVFHLECHGKMQEANPFNTTIWFSLMQSLASELIELCSDTITKQIGRRLYKLGYATNKSVGGYITYYGLNGRPKDYTGTKYGILSATIEGCGRLYGETGYSANTQKINCEALENFVLRVMDALDSSVKK